VWQNYWTVALRTLARNKTYSAINIAGLAIGMAACVMILLYVRYEEGYDSWIPNVENTYELQTWYPHPQSGDPLFLQMSPWVTEAAIRKDFPEVQGAVYALGAQPVFVKDGQVASTEDYLISDGDFLKVVQLPILAGSTLRATQTAVITRTEAIRRFGTDQVVGRTLSLISKGVTSDFRIAGVLKDLPRNSSFKVNAILRMDFDSLFAGQKAMLDNWGSQMGWVWLKLRPGTDVNALQAAEPAWEKRNIPDELNGTVRFNAGDDQDWHFVNLRDVHLGKAQGGAMTPGNDRRTVATFAIIALLILGTAIVNFTNLATARASQRAREVALRKVVGATRRQLIMQFLAESICISALAMLLGLTFAELTLPWFAAFLNADLKLNYLGANGVLLPAIGLTLIVGIASGLYPAFFLSRFEPALVLKANRSVAETPGTGRMRTTLVVGQFAISIGLMICTAIIYGQTVYARTVDPGYKRDHILQVANMGRLQLVPKAEMIEQQMKRIPGVDAVGLTFVGVATKSYNPGGVIPPGGNHQVTLAEYPVSPGIFDAMGLRLLAGRWFDPDRPADDMTLDFPFQRSQEIELAKRGVNVVLNASAARKLGFPSAGDAVGKVLRSELFEPGTGTAAINVIGVVADSHFNSVREPIDPIMFQGVSKGPPWMIIRYRGDPAAIEAAVKQQWKQVSVDVPFEAKFSEDIVRELYSSEKTRAEIFAAFSLLAVIIACLGLFGLAAFTVERRTKEIGIRKVLGAGTADIVRLLVWQFSRPIIIANVIAWPVAWWLMRDWLNGFDQRIALTPVPFALAAAVAFAIAIGTVAGHALRAARVNPIHALRYE